MKSVFQFMTKVVSVVRSGLFPTLEKALSSWTLLYAQEHCHAATCLGKATYFQTFGYIQ